MESIENFTDNKIENKFTNTDPKPHIFYYNGNTDILINIFFNKVKPLEGIVKYKMVNWDNFPKTTNEAKKLSCNWIKLFNKNKQYQGLKITIFFHLNKKTIRFELKKNNLLLIDVEKEQNPIDIINSYLYQINQTVVFNCEKIEFLNFVDLEKCKELGKNISFQLEKIYPEKKFLVYINTNTKSIKITVLNI